MARPVTLFTGQWADLPLETLCQKAASWGFDGLELACWGDHFDVERALDDEEYAGGRRTILEQHGLELIRSVDLFTPLPERSIERLARCATVVEVPAGEVVIRKGDPGDLFYVIESGLVEDHVRNHAWNALTIMRGFQREEVGREVSLDAATLFDLAQRQAGGDLAAAV